MPQEILLTYLRGQQDPDDNWKGPSPLYRKRNAPAPFVLFVQKAAQDALRNQLACCPLD